MANTDNLKEPWAPGVSGNPNGRPPGTKNRSTIIRKWLDVTETVTNPVTGQKEELTQEDIITLVQLRHARDVNNARSHRNYMALMDGLYGRIQTLKIEEGEGPGPLDAIGKIDLSTLTREQLDKIETHLQAIADIIADIVPAGPGGILEIGAPKKGTE